MATVILQKAIKHLAGICDEACSKDGVRFNGMDSAFGKSLAQQEFWTEKQAKAAFRMIQKYATQLKGAGIDIFNLDKEKIIAIERPKKAESAEAKKTAKIIDGVIRMEFPFNWKTVNYIKEKIPGRKFDPVGKFWTCPSNKINALRLQEGGFILDEELSSFLIEKKEVIIEFNGLKRELFPYQKKGVAFVEKNKGRALIGDEMGLGKTIQAIAWLGIHPEKRPAIVICPASLKLNWEREIKMTLAKPEKIQVLSGRYSPQEIWGDIIIINYDILPNAYETEISPKGKKILVEIPFTGWVDHLIEKNPAAIIIDEFHYTKSAKTFRTKACKKICQKTKHIIGLSGTPIVNRPIEAFNILQMVDRNLFPNFMNYTRKFCDAKHNGFGWDFTGASNKEELHQILTETIMIRRLKKDVLPELPEKLYSYIPVEIDNLEKYRTVEQDFLSFLIEQKGREAAEKIRSAEHLVRIEGLKQLAAEGKLNQCLSWIEDYLENNGDKLIVFGVHKKIINAVMKKFKNIAVKVDGSVSPDDRQKAVDEFQNNPNVRLFVGNIQAAGTGLTLTAANGVAFLEYPWTPGELVQAEDRAHRIGQKNNVNIYFLMGAETIEEDIAELLDKKKKILAAILDGKEVPDTPLFQDLIEKYENKKED